LDDKDDWQTEMYPESDSSNSRSESHPENYFGSGFSYNSPPTAATNLTQDDRASPLPDDVVVSDTPPFPYLNNKLISYPSDSRTISEPLPISINHYSQSPPQHLNMQKPFSGPSLPPILQTRLQESPKQTRVVTSPIFSSPPSFSSPSSSISIEGNKSPSISSSSSSFSSSSSGGIKNSLSSSKNPQIPPLSRSSSSEDPPGSNKRLSTASQQQQQQPQATATDWVPDSHRICCVLCGRTFSLLFRRHHCRNCGEVVCGLCSATRREGQRICDNCKRALERRSARQRQWG